MRVALVRPPFYSFFGRQTKFAEPLSLLYLGASLECAGHEVNLVDGELIGTKYGKALSQNKYLFYLLRPLRMMPGKRHRIYNEVMTNPDHGVWYDVVEEIKRTDPDMVGITTYTAAMTGVKYICDILKHDIDVPIVLGGVHATALPERTLKETGADTIICGEGEEVIPYVAERFEESKHVPKLISFKRLRDLDSIPFPARHLLNDYNFYTTNIITSRGCPYNCVFCASDIMWGRQVRYRSPNNVLQEVDRLVENYKIKGFRICDDTFTLKKDRVLEICDGLIKRDYDVVFSCGIRADTMDLDIAKSLRSAKCHTVSMGVESGNPVVLVDIKKGITKEDAVKTATILKNAEIMLYAFFIVGHRTDTTSTIQDSIDFMKQLNPDFVEVNIMTPYPGTEPWSKEYEDIEWYKFFHQSSGIVFTDHLTREEVSREFVRAYKIFAKYSLRKTFSRKIRSLVGLGK